MKKVTSLFLVFLFAFFTSQTRAVYEYQFRPDSTKIDSIKTEWMYLDIAKDGSKYYSKKRFEQDSIVAEKIKQQIAIGSKNISVNRSDYSGNVAFEVEKNYQTSKIYLVSSIGNDTYTYAEDRPINWNISSERKKIGEFETQKAETNFAGRQWEAWFTTEVPFPDGPYKFHGLPGLIIKIKDKTNSHIMELKAIKPLKITEQEELKIDKEIPFMKTKPLEISRKQYAKQLQQYKNDPVKGMREILTRPNSKVVVKMDGQTLTESADILKALEKKTKEDLRKNNNSIEIEK